MVSVIIVNYHSQEYIMHCFKTMFEYHVAEDIEVIIVNNEGDLSQVKESYLNIKIIESPKNLGFSSANNLGLQQANGDFILFLNPDTYFISEVIQTCVYLLENDPKIGLLGCKLLNEDRTLQLSYHDGDCVFRKLFNRNPFIIKFFGGNKKARKSMKEIEDMHKSDHDANWLTGAFAMLRKKDIEAYDLYWNEDFFMYWEDVELCYRVRRSGFQCRYTNQAQLVHIGGSGENVSFSRFEMLERSKLVFLEKTRGRLVKNIYVTLMRCELRLEKFLEKRNSALSQSFKNEWEFYVVSKTT